MVDELKLLAMEISELLLNVESNEKQINWLSILESFGFDYLLDEYSRLTRSQYFGDEDYEYNVIGVLTQALHDNEEDAVKMVQYLFDKYGISSKRFDVLLNQHDLSNNNKKEICRTVFISYSNLNKEYCPLIKESLEKIGLEGFLAHEDINISREWEDEIFHQLKQSDIFIAILSEDFKASEYCSQEVGMALQKGAMMIPLSIDGTPSYGFLNKVQSKHIDNISQMHKEIVNHYPHAMIDIIINHLDNQDIFWSYNECNKLLELIKPHFYEFDENQVYNLVNVVLSNNQLHGDDGKSILRDFYEIHNYNIPEDLKGDFENIIF